MNIPAAFGTMLSMPLPEKVDPLPRQRDRTSRVFLRQSKRGSNQPLTFLVRDLAGGSIAGLSPKIVQMPHFGMLPPEELRAIARLTGGLVRGDGWRNEGRPHDSSAS